MQTRGKGVKIPKILRTSYKFSPIGGKNGGNTKTDIHTFTPSEGWVKAADLPSGRFQLEALVLDEGTSQVSSM